MAKTFAGLSGLIFMLLMISQFIAFFNYSNIPRVAAVEMANLLERANIGSLPLLIGMILVIVVLDLIIPGVVPKWAIFAPVFIPIFVRLDVAPQTLGAHLLGTCRMGNDPRTSVVDRYHRAHDVPNLFICDGSSFVTSGRGQPTMTIQALAFRAAEHIAGFARRGEI